MAPSTPSQLRTRERIETAIRLAAPALDLVLAAGERLSKIVEREDTEYTPPRRDPEPGEPADAPR